MKVDENAENSQIKNVIGWKAKKQKKLLNFSKLKNKAIW